MIILKSPITTILCTLVSFNIYTYAVIYNKALSTTAGGTATATSSTSSLTDYEANWAIDGVLTFCNSGAACPGPYLNKMYKSPPAQTKEDVQLIIDMGGIEKIISVYLSLEESDPEQHVGM